MAHDLPEDVLYLVFWELALREDFPTLYRCAVSSKALAPLALGHLYRYRHHRRRIHTDADSDSMHGQYPVNDEEAESAPQQELLVQKWSIMWRSIILSARGGTLYPYCRYLRSLELRDLQYLLEDQKFRGKIQA